MDILLIFNSALDLIFDGFLSLIHGLWGFLVQNGKTVNGGKWVMIISTLYVAELLPSLDISPMYEDLHLSAWHCYLYTRSLGYMGIYLIVLMHLKQTCTNIHILQEQFVSLTQTWKIWDRYVPCLVDLFSCITMWNKGSL